MCVCVVYVAADRRRRCTISMQVVKRVTNIRVQSTGAENRRKIHAKYMNTYTPYICMYICENAQAKKYENIRRENIHREHKKTSYYEKYLLNSPALAPAKR